MRRGFAAFAVVPGPFVQADGNPDQQRERFRCRPVRDAVRDWDTLREFGVHVLFRAGSTPLEDDARHLSDIVDGFIAQDQQ